MKRGLRGIGGTMVAVAAVVAGVVVAAPSASASTGFQHVHKVVTIPANGYVRDFVACPTGKAVTSGGVYTLGEDKDPGTEIMELGPDTAGDQAVWLFSIRNWRSKALKADLTVGCINPPEGYRIVSTDSTLAGNAYTRQTVMCPLGKVVLSGGARVVGEGTANFKTSLAESGPASLYVDGSLRSTWRTWVRNADTAPHTVQFYAVCSGPLAGYSVTSYHGPTLAIRPGTSGGPDGHTYQPAGICSLPEDEMQPFGGGMTIQGLSPSEYPNLRLSSSHSDFGDTEYYPARWNVGITNTGSVNRHVTMWAVCAKI